MHRGVPRDAPHAAPREDSYAVVDVGCDGDSFARDVLENTGVIFVPGSGFGPVMNDAVRISFGPLVHDLDKIEQGFARVRDYLAGQGRQRA